MIRECIVIGRRREARMLNQRNCGRKNGGTTRHGYGKKIFDMLKIENKIEMMMKKVKMYTRYKKVNYQVERLARLAMLHTTELIAKSTHRGKRVANYLGLGCSEASIVREKRTNRRRSRLPRAAAC
jgi:hypothetical protein